MAFLQPLGRALMLPIAVLPVAGLLLRFGQPDLVHLGLLNATTAAFLGAAGSAIFDQLGLLFAVGVAMGFARDSNGAASLAGLTCFLVAAKGAEVLLVVPPDIGAGLVGDARTTVIAAWRTAAIGRFDVPLGIISGLVGGNFYNRFATVALPDYLAFFGGRRFVPILSGLAGLVIGAALGFANGSLNEMIEALSRVVVNSGNFGLFTFGVLNRLLIVTGLHHILNNVAYFVIGDWHGVTGDLRRFFAGDPGAGVFMSGFFPIMMFGLPAACLAMYHEAAFDERKRIGGLLASMVLTSILTGVTEPIEFSFMFCAPLLFGVHAVLTGVSEVIMNILGIRLGFSFSAGLIDYVLNYEKATRPLLLIPVGLAYALVYYGVFRFAIRHWNLPTPGREPVLLDVSASKGTGNRAAAFTAALGGSSNLHEIGACTTRLRLVVQDPELVDETALRALGAVGVIRTSPHAVQVVLGPIADAIAMEMQSTIGAHASKLLVNADPKVPAIDPPAAIKDAVGGTQNIAEAKLYPGRWRIEVKDPQLVSTEPLVAKGLRAVTKPADGVVHVLVEDFENEPAGVI